MFNRQPTKSTLQRRVDRLRRKGRFAKALEIQRKLCENDADNIDGWELLAEIAEQADRLDLALAARFTVAKLSRAGPDDWLALAQSARAADFPGDAIDALFRAADSCAVVGQFERAIQLFDQVLEADPKHADARRLRQLISNRIARGQRDSGAESEEPTLTFLGGASTGAEDGVDETTNPLWSQAAPDLGSAESPTPAAYVRNVQPWPTVLDRQSLMFVGPMEKIDLELEGLAETVSLNENTPLVIQGDPVQLLYCIESGTVAVQRERGGFEDLGIISAGHFFGELGALMGLPSTTSAITAEPCVVRFVSRDRLRDQVSSSSKAPAVVSLLRAWYLETVFNICPLFAHDSDGWEQRQNELEWLVFRTGETLCDIGEACPLFVIVTGYASVVVKGDDDEQTITLGYLCPGDVAGEIDPSPVDVVAESTVTAIRLDRSVLDALPEAAKLGFAARVATCRHTLADPAAALAAAQAGGTGDIDTDDIDTDELDRSALDASDDKHGQPASDVPEETKDAAVSDDIGSSEEAAEAKEAPSEASAEKMSAEKMSAEKMAGDESLLPDDSVDEKTDGGDEKPNDHV